ncbi:DUF2264 domain-containing protein [Photobacterium kishitanii]|uniref:DUF2264 domain-containing protein n=1 Tax=Photobacterium kishitanii TaxID=318456 RepID=A0AAX0Z0M8_9GAMM|nr:DUF2264 domain-containing protein [Photobacterium kishitanii]PSX16883.1 DUF2264 domain-containing protein [Photobacterium kishitanii]PSX25533.1 DUF2264 domain-containing protein [Photobacterium kishitanii]PSX31509.1 DUF2264 domain-containing protein [Photobacterium kishitanii]PSX45549.1 DUF2264 domain-containing protein [Photobacterium kishitanii]
MINDVQTTAAVTELDVATKSHHIAPQALYTAKNISATERPTIPYEHPTTAMYLKLFKQRLVRLKMKASTYSINDEAVAECFAKADVSIESKCEYLVRYVAEAFEHYAVWDYSHAYYPGRPSQQSARTDAMEGTSRVLPTLAAWVSQHGPQPLAGLNGKPLDIVAILRRAFLAGTDPQHAGYWGQLHDYDQRICESADLALALWLSREYVWQQMTTQEQTQIITWFKQVNHCQTVDNNWHLFPLTVQLVIKVLTGEDTVAYDKYERVKQFHVGDGWFRDGAKGNYDYYNAWGFHYSLYWLDQIDSSFDGDFIRQTLADFVSQYRYLFTAEGLPFFGRSACYRLAAAAPLIMAVDQHSDVIATGEAQRAFATSLEYFISHGAMQHGAPTQGLFGDDGRLVDNYSGPASSFWSLRALNIALFCGDRCGLWQAPQQPLPVEQGDFNFALPAINAQVIGIFETKEVVVIFKNDYTIDQNPLSRRLESQSARHYWLENILGRAERPKNNLLRKGITCYSSKMSHFF